MTDDTPWYSPNHQPPVRQPRAGELLWEISRAAHVHTCELRDHGGFVEAEILKDGDLGIGKRFDTRAQAVQWAELVRGDIEKGAA